MCTIVLLSVLLTLKSQIAGVTRLTDWTYGLTALTNNLGIIHLLQHWGHSYQVTTGGAALPYKSWHWCVH